MNVLSLFDGMSCCHIALDMVGIDVGKYYAAEIDKHAIKVTQANYPDTIQIGDVTKWRDWDIDWESIDLVTGGFPCQAWSVAGKQLGDKDERGILFWTMLDIMQKVLSHNPQAKFLIENVKMKQEFENYITHHTSQALGKINKHLINSALVSAQNRQRFYWTNIDGIKQPHDKGLVLADVIEDDNFNHAVRSHGDYIDKGDKSMCIDANYHKGADNHGQRSLIQVGSLYENNGDAGRIYHPSGKGRTLKGDAGGGGAKMGLIGTSELNYRKLTPLECERLQTVPENYTLVMENDKQVVSDTQRYRMLGNGWTVDVIAHILSNLKK